MGGCCATQKIPLPPHLCYEANTEISSHKAANSYNFEVSEPTKFSAKQSRIEQLAQYDPQRLFKQSNVNACFRHLTYSGELGCEGDKRSETTMPTQLGNSGNLSVWRLK